MTIFLTGATGYIGSYVAHGLMGEHDQKIAVLVRAKNQEDGAKRLWQSLQLHMDFATFYEHLHQRIEIVLGDLTEKNLGLNDAEFKTLAQAWSKGWDLAEQAARGVPHEDPTRDRDR